MARFLDALHAKPEGRTKSDLQRAVRVNYDVFRGYLDLLEERQLVERRGEGRQELVLLTAPGTTARMRLLEWVDDVLGGWPG